MEQTPPARKAYPSDVRDAECGDPGQPIGQDQSQGGPRGDDAHKQVSGRERQLLVDTQGFVLKVVGAAADVQDRSGARLVAQALRLYGPALPRLELVWADAGYSGHLVDDLREQMGWTLAVVKRTDTQPPSTFAVQPHRWIVERPCSWWGGLRRLSKDYEYQVESSGRVERGPDLCRDASSHAPTFDPHTGWFQSCWIPFKTVS